MFPVRDTLHDYLERKFVAQIYKSKPKLQDGPEREPSRYQFSALLIVLEGFVLLHVHPGLGANCNNHNNKTGESDICAVIFLKIYSRHHRHIHRPGKYLVPSVAQQ